MRFKGVLHFLKLMSNDSFLMLTKLIPYTLSPVESNYPSILPGNRKKKYFGNKIYLNIYTILGFCKCVAYLKDRGLYENKKQISKDYLDQIMNSYLPNYDYQCGDYLYLDNNPNCVVFTNESQKNEFYILEFRYIMTYASNIEAQVY